MRNTNIITKEDLFQEYITKNKTTVEIAKQYNCSPNKIGMTLREYNITRKARGPRKGNKLSLEHRHKISLKNLNNTYCKGHKLTKEHKQKISEGCKGKNAASYIDGRKQLLNNWKMQVKIRDKMTCQICGVKKQNFKDKNICAHHIKSKKDFPDLTYNIDNGITLCRSCHVIYEKKPNVLLELIKGENNGKEAKKMVRRCTQ
jgi:5-methylcytosine-specific restriction endonuclease McrA